MDPISEQDGSQDWATVPRATLIEHILARYHRVHRQQLAELIPLARRVESVHAEHPACPLGLAEHLDTMAHELESHMQKEERILFPLLEQGLPAAGLPPVMVMRQEHELHLKALERLMELARQLEVPEGACKSWQNLLIGLGALRSDLLAHMKLENEVLFV